MSDYKANANWIRRQSMAVDPSNHHYIVLHLLNQWMETQALAAVSGKLLDYGSGGQPYRELLEPAVQQYLTADVAAYNGIEPDFLLVPDRPIPIEDHSVDVVLSAQTLEHVPSPDFYLSESARVLVPGGTLILTAPMQWRHHEVPYDYFRFTRYGLEALLSRHGFVIEKMDSTGGAFALIGQILLNHLNERKFYGKRTYRLINRLAMFLDRRYPDGEDVINWMCIARVPEL